MGQRSFPAIAMLRKTHQSSDSKPFWNKSRNSSVGIFLDAENLTQFLKAEGGRRLVDWAVEFGNPIVRRAYGDWSLPIKSR